MRQRKLGSHTPPCHRRMVITTLFSVLLAALQRREGGGGRRKGSGPGAAPPPCLKCTNTHFEPVLSHWGPFKLPKSLENWPMCELKPVKNRSKMCFSKKDVGPVVVLKQNHCAILSPFQQNFAHFATCKQHIVHFPRTLQPYRGCASRWGYKCGLKGKYTQTSFSFFCFERCCVPKARILP